MPDENCHFADFVIVGGGVCGVSIVEELDELLEGERAQQPGTSGDQKIFFITGKSGFVKRAVNAKACGQVAFSFDIECNKATELYKRSGRIQIWMENVKSWNAANKAIVLEDGMQILYGKLAIATGASPKQIFRPHPLLIRLRDTQTVRDLERKLSAARRVLIIGNGGIASELAFELKGIEIVWAIRHTSISAAYFDAAAAKFFESHLFNGPNEQQNEQQRAKMNMYRSVVGKNGSNKIHGEEAGASAAGSALGPHWFAKLAQTTKGGSSRKVHVISEVELVNLFENQPLDNKNEQQQEQQQLLLEMPDDTFLPNSTDWHLWAMLSNGKCVGCDLIIEATGAVPNSRQWKRDCPELALAPDEGILVDEHLRTNQSDVYAAGDVCTANWSHSSPHWKQIRLWTQARQMGVYCARSMLIKPDELLPDIAFDIFTHVTNFFGYKVVLLGDFNGEKLEKPFELCYRITEGHEYIKVVIKEHRIQGAVLIGDTELEETMENLILNQTDIAQIEEQLLDPQVDLEDFFD